MLIYFYNLNKIVCLSYYYIYMFSMIFRIKIIILISIAKIMIKDFCLGGYK